jgi:anhydro-N-acetylmuramic acid kinase
MRALKVLGMMSGTSLDGVDAAVLVTDGVQVFENGPSAFRPYTNAQRQVLRRALGQWPGQSAVAEAAAIVEQTHIELAREFQGLNLIGFHGQTLAHDPAGRGTHQAGDGAVLGRALGLPVAWDFRSADVAAGGQGAPLAPFYHWALTRDLLKPVGVLNLGGVANVTVISDGDAPDAPGVLAAWDTGPANALMDDLVLSRLGLSFDKGGQIAAKGQADFAIVDRALQSDFSRKIPPKSLDRNDYSWLAGGVAAMSVENALATFLQVSVQLIAQSVKSYDLSQMIVCGGGRHNAVMMQELAQALACPVRPAEAVGWDGDMLEAQAFAFLAARVQRGLPISAPGTTGAPRPMIGGKLFAE